jgi:hypothetical protein
MGTMRSFNLSTLATAAFATTLLCLQLQPAWAGGEGFSKDDLGGGKETVDTKSYGDVGLGKFKANPWHIAVSLRTGYDDNVNMTKFDEQQSWFSSLSGELTYNAGSPRTQIRLTLGGGVTYYWDQSDNSIFNNNRDYDVNAYLSLAIVHKATPRLTLGATVYASYQTQPSFDTFANGGNFNQTNQNFLRPPPRSSPNTASASSTIRIAMCATRPRITSWAVSITALIRALVFPRAAALKSACSTTTRCKVILRIRTAN